MANDRRTRTRTALQVTSGTLALAFLIVSVISDTAAAWDTTKKVVKDHPLLGWGLAAALLVVLLAIAASWKMRSLGEQDQEPGETPTSAVEDRRRRADIKSAQELLGDLSQEGQIRETLSGDFPGKRYSSDVARGLEKIEDRWTGSTITIYDAELGQHLAEAKAAFLDWWGSVYPRLDAPEHLEGRELDLEIERQWGDPDQTEYHDLIREMNTKRHSMNEALSKVDSRLYQLRVDAGALDAEQPKRPMVG